MTADEGRQRLAVSGLASRLETRSKILDSLARTSNFMLIDWVNMRSDIDEAFEETMTLLGVYEEDETLDEIEGEEELDTELHPLDPDEDADDFWTDDI